MLIPIHIWFITFVTILSIILVELRTSYIESFNITRIYLLLITLTLIISFTICFQADINIFIELLFAYLAELFLSVDNILIFIMIFNYFNINLVYQHKILFLGIYGAIFFRILVTMIGVYVINISHWILVLISLLTIISIYSLNVFNFNKGKALYQPIKNYLILNKSDSGKLFFIDKGRIYITSNGIILILIEKIDIFFALDSISAVLSITNIPFIAINSNIFSTISMRVIYVIVRKINISNYIKNVTIYIMVYISVKILSVSFNINICNEIFIIFILIFISILILNFIFYYFRPRSESN